MNNIIVNNNKITINPIKNSYWVIPDKFLAGEYPRDLDEKSSIEKIKALVNAGIRAFIDLTAKDDNLKPYDYLLKPYQSLNIQHINFPIPDLSVPSTKDTTINILDTIKKHIKAQETVYLHCWGGVGRTGLIVGCWLSEHSYCGQKALIRLKELWKECPKSTIRNAPETEEQKNYVIKWNRNKQ